MRTFSREHLALASLYLGTMGAILDLNAQAKALRAAGRAADLTALIPEAERLNALVREQQLDVADACPEDEDPNVWCPALCAAADPATEARVNAALVEDEAEQAEARRKATEETNRIVAACAAASGLPERIITIGLAFGQIQAFRLPEGATAPAGALDTGGGVYVSGLPSRAEVAAKMAAIEAERSAGRGAFATLFEDEDSDEDEDADEG